MATNAELAAQIADTQKQVGELVDVIKTGMSKRNTGARPAPAARTGENIMGSRGFQFGKLLAAKAGKIAPEQAKIELELSDRLMKKCYNQNWRGDHGSSVLAPIWPEAFNEETLDEGMYQEMKSLLYAGVYGADPYEMKALSEQVYGQKSAVSPALSWIDQTLGGSFVAPATFGAPIELLRNQEILMRAGATVIPLGPSGKITFPRLTTATTGGVSAENTQQTPVQPKTGNLTLSAKKIISTVVMPGELLRFGSPAAEAMVRTDMFKTVSLLADYYFLHGNGSDLQPLGLATMGAASGNPYGVGLVTAGVTNQLTAGNIYDFQSVIEESAGKATAYIMRPKMKWAIYKARWTSYSGGANTGGFLFDFTRGPDGQMRPVLAGLDVVDSPQVSKTRGSGSQTWVGAINGPDYLIGMFGAIEFTQSDAGWTLLSSDQVAVRALLHCDGGMRHPSQFSFCDALNFVVGDS